MGKIVGVLAVVVALVPARGAAGAEEAATGAECREERLAVEVPGLGERTLAGTLCRPAGGAPATVQVLLPGGTYNRTYWDSTYRPEDYSYRRAAVAAGYATFAVDRLGTGASDRPPGLLVTNEAHAAGIAQVVDALRSGSVGGHPYERVVLVGHSYGSVVAWYTAATHRNVDAVLVTGLLHRIGLGFTPQYPAALDPAFLGEITDPSYLTTVPGSRSTFHAPDADPELVALDEATKDTVTLAEVAGIPVALVNGISQRIDVPVLVAVGTGDQVFCGPLGTDCSSAASVRAAEEGSYPGAPCLDTFVLDGSGHLLTAARNAPAFFAAATAWADRVVGPDGHAPGCAAPSQSDRAGAPTRPPVRRPAERAGRLVLLPAQALAPDPSDRPGAGTGVEVAAANSSRVVGSSNATTAHTSVFPARRHPSTRWLPSSRARLPSR